MKAVNSKKEEGQLSVAQLQAEIKRQYFDKVDEFPEIDQNLIKMILIASCETEYAPRDQLEAKIHYFREHYFRPLLPVNRPETRSIGKSQLFTYIARDSLKNYKTNVVAEFYFYIKQIIEVEVFEREALLINNDDSLSAE